MHLNPLYRAAADGNLERVQLLLDMGADPNPLPPGAGRWTPLGAALRGWNAPIVWLLLAAGARVQPPNPGDDEDDVALLRLWRQRETRPRSTAHYERRTPATSKSRGSASPTRRTAPTAGTARPTWARTSSGRRLPWIAGS